MLIRTNNEVEGWHRSLNECTKNGQAHVYMLVSLLLGEGEFVVIHVQLQLHGSKGHVDPKCVVKEEGFKVLAKILN